MMLVDTGMLLAKHMEEDDLRFADRLSNPKRLLAKFMLEIEHSHRPVLVLLSDLRLYIAPRKKLLGRYVKFNIPLNDVVEVAVVRRKTGLYAAIVSFMTGTDQLKRAVLVAQDGLQKEFVRLLISSGQLLNLGRLRRDQMRWHLPDAFLPVPSPHPSARSALALQYQACCDALGVTPASNALKTFMNEALDVFDPIQLLETSKPSNSELKALCLAARNCTLFTAIKLENGSALNDDAVECIALALGLQNQVTSVTISDVNFGRSGSEALSSAFESKEGAPRLTELSLYQAHLSLPSIRLLMSSLPPLAKLDLACCGLSSSSVAHLCSNLWPTSLHLLNLSKAACGRSGSEALAAFLSRSISLRYLILIGAQPDTESIIAAALKSPDLPLQGLNLSQNSMPETSCLLLAEYLSKPNSLDELILSDVKAISADLEILFFACVRKNQSVASGLKLDLSGCEIGSNSLMFMAKHQVQFTQSRLQVLDLSDCRLGYQGLANVLAAAITIQSLETLILSGNNRSKFFSKGMVELQDALAQVACASTVRRLILDELDYERALPSAVFVPMFEKLQSSPCCLQWLSVAGLHLNEPTFLLLASALKTNRCLIYLDADRNQSSLRALTGLGESIRYNDTLCFLYLEQDLSRLHRVSTAIAEAIAELIRTRMQLNRRRRKAIDHNPVIFEAKDSRFQRSDFRSSSREDIPGSAVCSPHRGINGEICDLISCQAVS